MLLVQIVEEFKVEVSSLQHTETQTPHTHITWHDTYTTHTSHGRTHTSHTHTSHHMTWQLHHTHITWHDPADVMKVCFWGVWQRAARLQTPLILTLVQCLRTSKQPRSSSVTKLQRTLPFPSRCCANFCVLSPSKKWVRKGQGRKHTFLPIKVLCEFLYFVATKEMSVQRARTQAHVPSHKGAVQTIVFYRHQRNECAKGKDASTLPSPSRCCANFCICSHQRNECAKGKDASTRSFP